MFFGLYNSPATFQRMMNDIFKDLIESRKVIVYLDNILIHTAGLLKNHISMVQIVLQVLRTYQLYLKPEKCEFYKQEVEYLGHIVLKGIVSMDPTNVSAVQNWPTPNIKSRKSYNNSLDLSIIIANSSRMIQKLQSPSMN
jgi:Reverse transcriptase (RNA-dependent DNA polymerase)